MCVIDRYGFRGEGHGELSQSTAANPFATIGAQSRREKAVDGLYLYTRPVLEYRRRRTDDERDHFAELFHSRRIEASP